jgi:hypothetical protein
MLSPELSNSLTRIENRLGTLEAKSFYDNLKMASLQEEQDTEANRATLNRVVVNGIRIPSFSRMTENEKVPLMKSKVQELAKELAEGTSSSETSWEVVFARHLNKQVRGQVSTVIEAKFATEQIATEFRKNYVSKRNNPEYDGLVVAPAVRLATRVRVEILVAICNLLRSHDKSISKVLCMQFIPKPVIKITRKNDRNVESVQTMTFLEAVSWVKERDLEGKINLQKAHRRAGSAFRGVLQQTFVLLK